MKRNILCFSILAGFVAIIAIFEITYSNILAADIDKAVDSCKAEEPLACYNICTELKERFESREVLNELFLSRKMIDKLNQGMNNLIVYAMYNDRENFTRCLNILAICNEDIHNAGIF